MNHFLRCLVGVVRIRNIKKWGLKSRDAFQMMRRSCAKSGGMSKLEATDEMKQ